MSKQAVGVTCLCVAALLVGYGIGVALVAGTAMLSEDSVLPFLADG